MLPKRQSGFINFTRVLLGPYPLLEASLYLGERKGLTLHRIRQMLNAGKAPAKYRLKLQRLTKELIALPIGAPPKANIIGEPAYRAIEAMRRADVQQAEEIASKALRENERDWQTGQPQKFTELQRKFNRLVHGMAWAQNSKKAAIDEGLPALYRLNLETNQYIANNHIDTSSEQGKAWMYLSSMTLSYSIAYLVCKLAFGWFTNESRLKRYDDKEHQKKLANKLIRVKLRVFQDLIDEDGFEKLYRDCFTIRVAWNAAQVATVAESQGAFIWCLDAIFKTYPDVFLGFIEALKGDPDTENMLSQTCVAPFVAACVDKL